MVHLISFKTSKFDITKERLNPINPLAGESVLIWLREHVLDSRYSSTEPDYEDWGWYMDAIDGVSSYLIGSIAFPGESSRPDEEIDWQIQIHRIRSFMDKLLGRNKMVADDPLVTRILSALLGNEDFIDVELDGVDPHSNAG